MSQIFGSNFIQQQIESEIEAGLDPSSIRLRFPPEPNGYLHIGHARAICLNFDLARRFGGRCLVRLDDTNPAAESQEFVDAILEQIRWLGYQWDELRYTSDYFERLYDYTVRLVEMGLAYVDDQSPEQISAGRGSLTSPGSDSPFRGRGVADNLDLLAAMRAGQPRNEASVVRARIDMAADNLNMRDPVIWRQRSERHYRLGDSWRIFPLYDFSHCLSDAIEGISHSLCTLEFADHRPLYDWFLDKLAGDGPRPRQIEFARMNISGILTSKRQIAQLIADGRVSDFDDARLMTLAGLRQRGIPAGVIVDFCRRAPISRAQGELELSYFLDLAREHLNSAAPRAMAVLDPLKVVIENIEPGQAIECDSPVYPQGESGQTRRLRLGREIYIERDDYREQPEKGFHRLAPGRSARLRSAGIIHCLGSQLGDDGSVAGLRCRIEPDSKGAKRDDQGNKVRATLHWVDAEDAVQARVLLLGEEPARGSSDVDGAGGDAGRGGDSPDVPAGETIEGLLEPGLGKAEPGQVYQFERLGYFCCHRPGEWLRTLPLRPGKKPDSPRRQ